MANPIDDFVAQTLAGRPRQGHTSLGDLVLGRHTVLGDLVLGVGPAPGPAEILPNATPWQRSQAAHLAEALARESAGGPGYYLPGGVVVASTPDLNLPGATRYGPMPSVLFKSYPDLMHQLGSEQNAGRSAVILSSHGGSTGLSTAFTGPVLGVRNGKIQHGADPSQHDIFSLDRFLADLPVHYRQAVLAACNPKYVLGQTDATFDRNADAAIQSSVPVAVHTRHRDMLFQEGEAVHDPRNPTGAYHGGHRPVATPLAPDLVGLSARSPLPAVRSNPDVPILAGNAALHGTDLIDEENVAYPSTDQYSRAAALMEWAKRQVPGWIRQDQQANYNATFGSPDFVPATLLPPVPRGR